MFFPPQKKTEVLILKGCTFKIYCSKNRCVGKLEGKEFSCSGEQIFIEWLLYARQSGTIFVLGCTGVRGTKFLSRNLVETNQFLLVQTPSSVNWNCLLAAADTDGSLVSVSSSHFSLLPQNQCVSLCSSVLRGLLLIHLTLTCPLTCPKGRTKMTRA